MEKIDVNLMVSVAAMKIGTKTLPGVDEWSRVATNIDTTNSIGGDPEACILLHGVLEATASLAVSEPKLQVVAVALHMGPRWGGRATLTLAENGNLKEGVLTHITDLWGILYRRKHGLQSKEDLTRKFIRRAYCYSVSKNLKRYDKWIPRLEVFAWALTTRDDNVKRFQKIVRALRFVHVFLREIETRKHASGETLYTELLPWLMSESKNDNWGGLIKKMDTIRAEWDAVSGRFEEWASNLDWPKGLGELKDERERAPVQDWVNGIAATSASDRTTVTSALVIRALQSVTSHHRHIKKLLDASEPPLKPLPAASFSEILNALPAASVSEILPAASVSQTLKPLFASPMTVREITGTPKVEIQITLPTGLEEWQKLIRPMYESIIPRITTNLINKEAEALCRFAEQFPRTSQGVVHCECALVAYLEGIGKADGQFNYIGVSKLSCGACHAWLMAYNSTCGAKLKYYTAGTHSKWYEPWAIPPSLDSDELKQALSRTVCEQFVKYCDPSHSFRNQNREDFTGSAHLFTR